MLKYVILQAASGERLAFFCLPPVSHRELWLAAERIPLSPPRLVSAGFVSFGPAGEPTVHPGRSESLNLGPGPDDQTYLRIACRASAELNDVAAHMPY